LNGCGRNGRDKADVSGEGSVFQISQAHDRWMPVLIPD
jgi:hypothetical protein